MKYSSLFEIISVAHFELHKFLQQNCLFVWLVFLNINRTICDVGTGGPSLLYIYNFCSASLIDHISTDRTRNLGCAC